MHLEPGLEPGVHMRVHTCNKLGRVFRHETLEDTHANSNKRVVVRIPFVVAHGSPRDIVRSVRGARAHQEVVVGNRWSGCCP